MKFSIHAFTRKLRGAALLAASSSLLMAEPFQGSSLEDYLQQAQTANPQLKAFKQRYEAAMQRIPQASTLPDPMLQITHFVESVQTRTGPQEKVIMLGQRIPWFGKLSSRKAAASADAESLWYAYQNQQLQLARTVALSYYEYGYAREAIRLTQENRDLLSELEPIIEEKVRAGGEINALLRLKVEIGKVDDRLQSLMQLRISLSAKLSGILALPAKHLLPWPEWDTPEPLLLNTPSLMQAIRANNPELQMLERQVASAEARREIARLESYPDITFGINYIQIGEPEVMRDTPNAGQDPWGVSVAVNLPIWFEKYNAAKAEALANKRATEYDYEQRFNRLRAELGSSLSQLNDANRRLKLYGDELIDLAEQAVENTRSSYQNGRTGILEVIDSERSLLDLQLLYWRAASDAWQERVTIQSIVNQPIQGNFNSTKTDTSK